MTGGEGGDKLMGEGGADALEGDDGDDMLEGGSGGDVLQGGGGSDSLNGGASFLVGADGDDRLGGGRGADELVGGRGNDELDGGPDADGMSGESGKDTVTYEDRTAPVRVSLNGIADDGEAGEGDNVRSDVEVIVGGEVDDTLFGNTDANTVNGGPGEDLIVGDVDRDRLLGGDEPDLVQARDGVRDDVACGDAGDLAIADGGDTVIKCETVDRPGNRRPIVGRYALVRPGAEFRLRLPHGRRFYPLSEKLKIPIGSTIDPQAGAVRLSTAKNRGGARQAAAVSAGRFTVRQQRRRRPVTELRLAGKPAACKGSSSRRRGARSALRPSARKLRINVDEKGRRGGWRVHGRYSIGGSRGTDWITEETCNGTVTTVISGTVRVRDLGRRKTVSVHAGERYVARP
jgi:hypothetical protein